MNKKGFTLIELLIVIGIIAIMATVVVLALNPAELLKKARDSRRVSELKSINDAVALAVVQVPPLYIGAPNTIYVSLPDSDPQCGSWNLPTATGYTYICKEASDYRKSDGTGWLPINFDILPIKSFSVLPVDPVNTNANSAGLYYAYIAGSWEITAQMESSDYRAGGNKDLVSKDGGQTNLLYEIGTHLNLMPPEIFDRTGASSTPADAPPIISSVGPVSLTTKQVTIFWNTNENADSQVEYGLTSSYGSQTTLNSSLVTSHSQTITGLTPNTLYHFRVLSKDSGNNLATSTDYTFTTWPVPALMNPDFEDTCSDGSAPPSWNVSLGGESGVACITSAVAQSGSRWIYAYNYTYAYQALSLRSGIQYTFSVYAKQNDWTANSSTLLISSLPGGGTSYCSSTTTSETWIQLSCSYTPTSNISAYFNLKGGAVATGGYMSRFDNATTSAN